MRRLTTIIALCGAITLCYAAPSMAQQKVSSDSGPMLATMAGVVVGGGLAYYFYPLSVTAVALGGIAGGALGAWWHGMAESDSYTPLPRKSDVDGSDKPYRLIAYGEGIRQTH